MHLQKLYLQYFLRNYVHGLYFVGFWCRLVMIGFAHILQGPDYNNDTVGTPYNTNVGVQKIPDRAIWKPVVAKRNNTNPWSCPEPQIFVMHDSRQLHMAKQPASRDRLESISPLVHSSQTAWQLFNLGQSIEIRIPHLLGHIGQLHTNVFHTFDSVSLCCKRQISRLSNRMTHAHSQSNLA